MTGHTCITAADWEGTLDLPLPNPLYVFMKTSVEWFERARVISEALVPTPDRTATDTYPLLFMAWAWVPARSPRLAH